MNDHEAERHDVKLKIELESQFLNLNVNGVVHVMHHAIDADGSRICPDDLARLDETLRDSRKLLHRLARLDAATPKVS